MLLAGYVFYGGWLAKEWGIDPKRKTPAHELEDGMDYVPAKAPVLMGHHFSSIAGAGPINGPIQAAVFGWVPVLLWVVIGGIFFGGVHDFGALFASIRHKGQSIGEVISGGSLRLGPRPSLGSDRRHLLRRRARFWRALRLNTPQRPVHRRSYFRFHGPHR